MTAASFDQHVTVLFLDGGVRQLVDDGRGDIATAALKALPLYDVSAIWVGRESLSRQGLGPDDLLIPADPLDEIQVRKLMGAHDLVWVG